MKDSEFVFDYVQLLYHKCHKINSVCGGSYIDFPDWIKAAMNPINKKYSNCSQYAVTVALNHEEIKRDLQKKTKIKPFINKYNWEGINFPSQKDDCKNFQKNNVAITLSILYAKKEKIYPTDVSKHNSNIEKKVILLMIPNEEKRYYLAVKKLSDY